MKPFIDECGIIHIAYMATATFLSKEVVTTSATIWMSEIRRFLGLRECSPILFCGIIFHIFLETPWFQGVFSLLFGTLLCSRECVGIPGAVRACAMRPILNLRYISYYYCFPEHFTSIPFYFIVYSIYTSACTVVTHPFASVAYRDNRKLIPFLVLITRII